MTIRPNGDVICNGCGVRLENDSVVHAVIVVGLTGDGNVANFHYCLRRDDVPSGLQLTDEGEELPRGAQRCGAAVLTPERMVGVPGLDETGGVFPLRQPPPPAPTPEPEPKPGT